MNSVQFPDYQLPNAHQEDFSPYESNGGTIVAIGGDDYALIASDTRLSSGYSIHTRYQNKLFYLSPNTVLGSAGCWCDTLALTSLVRARMQMYEHLHLKVMSTEAVSQMLSILMYSKRFFPYYLSNILAGLDENGEGVVYSYDPIGHCERSKYRAGGSAGAFLQPVLDSYIGKKNQNVSNELKDKITKEDAVKLVNDAFVSAAERDIYTGDGIIINLITADGVETIETKLRED